MGEAMKNYYNKGVDESTRATVGKHLEKINDYIDQVTNPTRRDYIQTNKANAAAVYDQMRADAYQAINEHKQKRLMKIESEIKKNRQFSASHREENPNRQRNYRLKAQLASDEELMKKIQPLRNAQGAGELIQSFENSNDLEAYLQEANNRPKLKNATKVVAETFQKSGADPTDLDRPDVLFAIDQVREIENEEPGTIKVTLYDQDGNAKGKMPVRFDDLTDKEKLSKEFQLKL